MNDQPKKFVNIKCRYFLFLF